VLGGGRLGGYQMSPYALRTSFARQRPSNRTVTSK